MNRAPEFFRRVINQVRRLVEGDTQSNPPPNLPAFRVTRTANKEPVQVSTSRRQETTTEPGFRVTRKPGQFDNPTRRKIEIVNIQPRIYPPRRFILFREPWEEFGWRQVRPGLFEGTYQVRDRTWQGKACFPNSKPSGAIFDIYCKNPPTQLKTYQHRACWHHDGNGWYWIHFNVAPRDLASAIRNVEHSLADMTGGF